MPTYCFKCKECGRIVDNRILPITHAEVDKPVCCTLPMEYRITQAPMVQWKDPIIEPFRNPAAARDSEDSVILNTKQRREFMKKNDLVDANDFIPPTNQEQKEAVAEMEESVKAITPTRKEKAQLEKAGLSDIV